MDSAPSPEVSGTTPAVIPAAPAITLLTPVKRGMTVQVTISPNDIDGEVWVDNLTAVKVFYSETSGGESASTPVVLDGSFASGSVQEVSVLGLKPATQYFFEAVVSP